MGEVSLELMFELMKDMQRQIRDVQSDLKADIADVKADLAILHSDNLAFRSYLQAVGTEGHCTRTASERNRTELADLRSRIEAVERRLETTP